MPRLEVKHFGPKSGCSKELTCRTGGLVGRLAIVVCGSNRLFRPAASVTPALGQQSYLYSLEVLGLGFSQATCAGYLEHHGT